MEVHIDKEETKGFQQNRFDYFTRKGDQYFAEGGRIAEITVDPVLQRRARMSNNKVNGPDDAIVSEMIKTLPKEKVYTTTRCFQERVMG